MAHDDVRALGALVGWRAAFTLGLITLALGLVVIFRPTLSLVVIAVLLGVAMIVSGAYHLMRVLDGREQQRVWRTIVAVLSIVAGLVLIRHLHLTLALIGLFIGFTWIIQGIGWLMDGLSAGRGDPGLSATGRRNTGRGWSLFFGAISLIAGIVVVSSPISSVAALTLFMGAWLIVIGALEMYGGLAFRRAAARQDAAEADGTEVSVPGQRPGTGHRTAAQADTADQGAGHQSTGHQSTGHQSTGSQGTGADTRPAGHDVQG